jgi:hypothetical protein
MQEIQPCKTPPQVNIDGGNAVPEPLSRFQQSNQEARTMLAPTMTPPQASVNNGITAWVDNRRIDAVWSINQNRNSWVSIQDVGWKKFADNSDSAIVAFTILAAHARQMQSVYTYREEADTMIHECYVW